MSATPSSPIEELRAYLLIGCQQNAGGGMCSSRKCLIRGGWKPGEKGDYSLATCPEREASGLLGKMFSALQTINRIASPNPHRTMVDGVIRDLDAIVATARAAISQAEVRRP